LQRFPGDGPWRADVSKEVVDLKLNMEALPRIAVAAVAGALAQQNQPKLRARRPNSRCS
jgi:hypothetical protein